MFTWVCLCVPCSAPLVHASVPCWILLLPFLQPTANLFWFLFHLPVDLTFQLLSSSLMTSRLTLLVLSLSTVWKSEPFLRMRDSGELAAQRRATRLLGSFGRCRLPLQTPDLAGCQDAELPSHAPPLLGLSIPLGPPGQQTLPECVRARKHSRTVGVWEGPGPGAGQQVPGSLAPLCSLGRELCAALPDTRGLLAACTSVLGLCAESRVVPGLWPCSSLHSAALPGSFKVTVTC